MGAPRKNPPKDAAEIIERLAAAGHSIVGIAKQLGVVKETFKRWCEDDEALQDAFEVGREFERQMLHALVVESARLNKPANVNAFFLLKSKHGYRDNDPSQVNVGVAVAPTNVLVVRDHGSNADWATKAAEQQRKLVAMAASPPQALRLPAPERTIHDAVIVPQRTAEQTLAAPSWAPANLAPISSIEVVRLDDSPVPAQPQRDIPEWRGNA